jgi:hypothetical protein
MLIVCRLIAGTFGSSPLANAGGSLADIWLVPPLAPKLQSANIWRPLHCNHLTSSPINEGKLWVCLQLPRSLDLFSAQLLVVLFRSMVRLPHNHTPPIIRRVDNGSFLEVDILGGLNICCRLLGDAGFFDS